MTWDLVKTGEAIAAALVVPGVTTYASPPLNLSPPALVVSYPELVDLGTRALGLDTATIALVAVVGFTAPPEQMGELIAAARAALAADRTLAGAVASCQLAQIRTIRADKVGGIDVLTGDLVLTVDV